MNVDFEKLFNSENVEKVNDAIQAYLPELFGQQLSLDNTDEIMKLYDEVSKLKSQEVTDLFIKYSDLKYIDTTYQNWLAYTIGFYNGIAKKLKQEKNSK